MTLQQEEPRSQERRKARKMVNGSSTTVATLLDLPLEVLMHVLLLLPFTSVVICQGVNYYLQNLVSESAELQYYIHLGISGLADNPRCSLSIPERLRKLITRERRWEELKFKFNKNIEVPLTTRWNRRRFFGGVLSLLYPDGILREVQVPNEVTQEAKWKETCPKQTLIDVAVRAHEHDLCIFLTAERQTVHTNTVVPRTRYRVQVHLSQLSTGGPHPDAQRDIAFEMQDEFGQLRAATACAGENLVIFLRDRLGMRKPDDQVYVYEWKIGKLKMRLSAPFGSYWHPLFLTTDIFLLPNASTGELEYFKIPQNQSEPTSNRPFFILSLPQLRPGRVFRNIYCYASPSPYDESHVSKPFYADPHHAIAIFNIIIQSAVAPQNDAAVFSFFIHRSSLVGYLDMFSTSISFGDRPMPVAYDDWGPPACRWFNDSIHGYRIGWIAAVFGQKYIPSPMSTAAPLVVFNFNPIDVARALTMERDSSQAKFQDEDGQELDQECIGAELSGGGEEGATGSEGTSYLYGGRVLKTSPDLLVEGTDPLPFVSQLPAKAVIRSRDPLNDPHDCFETPVYSLLPYTVCSSREKYDFDEFFLGDESILGIRWVRIMLIRDVWRESTSSIMDDGGNLYIKTFVSPTPCPSPEAGVSSIPMKLKEICP
ncbi:hypothetical protein P691DRAFT_808634 [Macrolepiota fuliginosa MF-IS2]|uniref:F-box domain-containing protein n=1 Tax=Macrolepiota fuliginosa MF-IS2 TaxID=1400762 RepID=A0A9P6C4D3_9AGAR|nr:hypothetical protein P691DRAFT_808634 [Macrolepiota fuliginosa MF-IS2]